VLFVIDDEYSGLVVHRVKEWHSLQEMTNVEFQNDE